MAQRILTILALATVILGQGMTPDASCGLNNGGRGYTCQGSPWGNCCSANGWCGSTAAYCGTGCQSQYGSCTGSTPTSSSSTTTPTPAPTTFSTCLASKSIAMAGVAEYNQRANPYNLRLKYSPAAVIVPASQQQVQDVVSCAAQSNLKVQAKSGGHSYASHSTGGKDGSVVVDLENFQEISVDANGVAKIGGGVRLGNLALGIYNQSQRALSHGTCPGVGIGGHATHGGYGYASRTWGLSLDSIIGADVVLANGTAVHTSTTAYSDLFWSLRGAADSFGIITTFYLQTQKAPTSVVNWQFSFPGVLRTPSIATSLILHLQEFAQNASVVDRKIGGMGIYMDVDGIFSLSGTYFGDINNFNTKIKPELLRTLPAPASSSVKANTWLDNLALLAGEPLATPKSGYAKHDDFFAKSLVVPTVSPLTSAGLGSYFNYISKNLSNGISWFSILNLYGGADSQINAISPGAASYADRDSLWVFQHYGWTTNQQAVGPQFPSNIQPFIQGLSDALVNAQPQTRFGAYLNYLDSSLSPGQAHELYYGGDVYNKLLGLKNKFDPKSVFWNPLAVGTS